MVIGCRGRFSFSALHPSISFFSISLNPTAASKPTYFKLQSHHPFFKPVKCIQSHSPDSISVKPNPRNYASGFGCSAVTFSSSQTAELVSSKLQILVDEFRGLSEPVDHAKRLLHYANLLPSLDEHFTDPACVYANLIFPSPSILTSNQTCASN
ncbi:hypothetical protein QN277_010797 [Acacia crassicarpa]|uniref:Uncharacterized protein n=1 Tax=Acacia crassicarpa TaxID=499986 RepID=A0AAE1IMV1_9FABA|nr:hypothetical protein QN277_010797 [Acacia crassicarpa]